MRRVITRRAPAEWEQPVRRVWPRPTVAIIITTYNDAQFLAEAIESVLAQTEQAREILVVDDGSADDPAPVLARFPDVRLVRQQNLGLAAARNTGLLAVTSDKLIFLDADDRLLPRAIASSLDCFDRVPEAGFVYGGHRRIDAIGRALDQDRYAAIGPEGYCDLLKGNYVGMHATVMYDRLKLCSVGGFDRTLRRCEDYDVYLRLSQVYPVASHPEIVAEYRWHGGNMSSDHRDMLHWVLLVHGRQKSHALKQHLTSEDWRCGQKSWRDYYAAEILEEAKHKWCERKSLGTMANALRTAAIVSPLFAAGWGLGMLRRSLSPAMPLSLAGRIKRVLGKYSGPPVGSVNLGDLDRVTPISPNFGFDRGTPIDRYYIENFLQRYAADIAGRVLEVGDDTYCRRFGGARITRQDVLHVSPDVHSATIVGDLSQPELLPAGVFDCLVVTQTLHLIFDMHAAVVEMRRALKAGGILLLTVPGISQIDRGEWGDCWFWSLTRSSAIRLFSDVFGTENVEVEVFGNVFAATAFLQGLAVEEVDQSKLDVVDTCYPITVAVRAQREY